MTFDSMFAHLFWYSIGVSNKTTIAAKNDIGNLLSERIKYVSDGVSDSEKYFLTSQTQAFTSLIILYGENKKAAMIHITAA